MRMVVRSQGGDRLVATVRGHEIIVDQPEEASGTDVGPTPTELFVAGLATCVAFYAELFLRRHGLPTDDLEVGCEFSMSDDRPARVASIELEVPVPSGFEAAWHEPLQRVLEHCAVHNSLRTPPSVTIHVGEPVAA